ncbi:SDR family NAD(P)-dependent oxidoreductase [Micromonospora sp. FIMYZ51]|uniref:type I polyketide synthase n=1 Tax=Micromonospora sp. FIMYZ51 TaxID=3051832 RepID=UPI00311D819E
MGDVVGGGVGGGDWGLLVEGVSVAAVNGPSSVVISGAVELVERVVAACGGRRCRRLAVSHGFHSVLMEPMLADFERVLVGVEFCRPVLPVVSNVFGRVVGEELLSPGYWVRQVREAVRFGDCVDVVVGGGVVTLLEVGPGGLAGLVDRVGVVVLSGLRRGRGECESLVGALGGLWVRGVSVDWGAFFAGRGGRWVSLPTYAFQHRRYWIEATIDKAAGEGVLDGEFWTAVERGDADGLQAMVGAPGAWPELLPALARWRRSRVERGLVDSWRYRLVTRPVPVDADARLAGTWLTLLPADGTRVDEIVATVRGAGADVEAVVVQPGTDRAALAQQLAEVGEVTGVLSVAAGDLMATVVVMQALADAGVTAPLWVLTRGATAPGTVVPEQAQVWALSQVFGLERPATWGGLIDLPQEWDERIAAGMVGALAAHKGEDQLVVRRSGISARRLVRAPLGATEGRGWAPRGTALVTGGTGGIGAHVARWLADLGAESLVLTSRRGLAAEGAQQLKDELEAAGTRVWVRACDVTDREALAELLADVPDLTAVFHAAGVASYSEVLHLDEAQLAAAAAGKVDGARNLDELTGDLDAFVMFSSGAAVWGSGGHGAYAAANAYLDALAQQRRARGRTATSVSWGGWASGGMLDDNEGAGDQLTRLGLRLMEPRLALQVLHQAIDHDETLLTVVDMDWARFAPSYTMARRRALIEDIPEVARVLGEDEDSALHEAATDELRQRLADRSAAERHAELLSLVRGAAAEVLGHSSVEEIAPTRPFQDFGFDSLTAMELRNRLTAATGLRLPASVVFDYPNPENLAAYLLTELFGAEAGTDSPVVAVRDAADDPLVIVGMACRYPGGVVTPEELWRLVSDGRDGISDVPTDRGWQEQGVGGGMQGGFVYSAGDFDPGFFGISPREAQSMDPQQRLLLECSWEALERAGVDPLSLRGSRTGVFVGGTSQEYGSVLAAAPEAAEGFALTGSSGSVMSGRVAYVLGLEGPAVTLDTACSSSLVALHLAGQALRNGECDLALAGGVTVLATPGVFAEFDRQGGLARDGRCKAFAAAADGTGWGEGVGVVVVERLSDARRNGHQVWAVVRGSAVNSDGASNGLTAPNGPSQQRVIRQALAVAGVSAGEVDVVEAHGTGTTLGDPIEAQALLATYGRGRPEGRPLWLGSVKSNIGHTQAAAGVAGLIKMVLAMRAGVLPRTLHVDEPTPQVDWSSGAVELLTEARQWRVDGRPRRAGISSFGISGTNAHVIIEEPPAEPEPDDESRYADPTVVAPLTGEIPVPWLLSGADRAGLRAQAEQIAAFVDRHPELPIADVGRSLASRSRLAHRAVVLGTDRPSLHDGLRNLAITGTTMADPRVAFVFPGQGAQWVGMAVSLWESSSVFGGSMVACEQALTPFVEWSLREVVFSGDEQLWERVDVVQPVLWAVMVSLAQLWRSCGVVPSVVVGHSQGEIAAAVVAGGLSLADGARVVALRSRVIGEVLSGAGGMVSVALPADEASRLVAEFEGVGVAAVNGPAAVVVSGAVAGLDALLARCERDGVRARRVPVDYASHSDQVDALEEQLLAALAEVTPGPSRLPMISSVTGELIDTSTMDARYWFTNLRETVRFEPAVRAMLASGYRIFVEVSPHPVLVPAVQESIDATQLDAVALGTLRRDDGGPGRFLASLAEAYVRGATVDWSLFFDGARRVDLPTYAFQRRRFWLRGQTSGAAGGSLDGEFWTAVERGDADGLETVVGAAGPWGEVVPALARWRRSRVERDLVDSWRYRLVSRPVTMGARSALTGTWLVLLPAEARGVRTGDVLATLRAAGADPQVFVVSDRGTLAGELAQVGEVAGVLTLATGDLMASVVAVQALADADVTAPMWLITEGAVPPGVVVPEQAQVWAFGQVVGLERPNTWGGLVDLPPTWDDQVGAALVSVLAGGGDGEDQLVLRPSGVFARRLVRARLDGGGRGWSPRGTILVTGGTGGVGAHVARWLVSLGAPELVLTSRRGLAAEGARQLVAELEAAGARVTVAACDVADRDALARLLAQIPDLSAVFHAAGTTAFRQVVESTAEDFAEVLAGKVAGARNLDELVGAVDAFVMFSSGAAVWGSAGNGAYAAANAFLDGLAQQRRARGLTATSVSWGGWQDTGMAGDQTGQLLSRLGVRLMPPRLALAALFQAIDHDETLLTVVDMDWERFAPGYTMARRRALIEDIPEAAQAISGDLAGQTLDETASAELRQRLVDVDPGGQHAILLDLVRAEAATVLAHDDALAIDEHRPFQDLGFTSLTAVEFRNRLRAATGLRLPATLVFDHPSPGALAVELRTQLLGAGSAELANAVDIGHELARIDRAIPLVDLDTHARDEIVDRLRELISKLGGTASMADLNSASDDEIFDFIDRDLGVS